jgi:hypothetical protein
MALLILLSSTGFSIDVHYCQDQVRGISLFGSAKSCHDKEINPPCHKTKKTCHQNTYSVENTSKDNCCHNKRVLIEKSDVDATSLQLATIENIKIQFVAAFIAVYVFNYNVDFAVQSFVQYKPPLPDKDVQVLYQSFLI